MRYILLDQSSQWESFKPLTLTRALSHLRIGIFTIKQKWELALGHECDVQTSSYLQLKYNAPVSDDKIYIYSHILPSEALVEQIQNLENGHALHYDGKLIAFRTSEPFNFESADFQYSKSIDFGNELVVLNQLVDLFRFNSAEIEKDFEVLTATRETEKIEDPYTRVYGDKVFVEKGVSIKAATLNAEEGPIYIGSDAVIQEGSVIIGPVSIGTNSKVGYNATIRQGTTVGPFCRVAGEVSNCIFMAYSNKSHDGFLGNSVVGEWCNFGANTNSSNLKNNYKSVALYNYASRSYSDTGVMNCGSFIGDYTKLGISTMLNTGTVIGVSCNVFDSGFQSKFVPSFSWGSKSQGYTDYKLDKAIETIKATMLRKEMKPSDEDLSILAYIFKNKHTLI